MSAARLNRGVLWGQLLAGLESSRASLEIARRGDQLLSEEDRQRLQSALDSLAGVAQRAWEGQNRDAKGKR